MGKAREHVYQTDLRWTGNRGTGTSGYADYTRDHELRTADKSMAMSSDPAFRGDPSRWNPEELLVGAMSSCHQLWYLHLCAVAGIVITAYADTAEGVMEERGGEGGRFTRITLRPVVTITDASRADEAMRLHGKAHELCYIAQSVNFPVTHEPTIRT